MGQVKDGGMTAKEKLIMQFPWADRGEDDLIAEFILKRDAWLIKRLREAIQSTLDLAGGER